MTEAGAPELTEAARLARRRTFEDEAARYDAARPTYPGPLFDTLAQYAGLRPGSRVLEVGPGTGQATTALAGRGWRVTAVELGEQLAAATRRRVAAFPAVEVVVGAFEDWSPPERAYDAAVCATSFHWLDPDRRLERFAIALRPGGTLAVVWTHHVVGGTQPFFTAAQACYRRWDPSTPAEVRWWSEDEIEPSTGELGASPWFTDVRSHRFGVDVSYSADGYLELLRTYSSTLTLSPERASGLLSCLRGLIEGEHGGTITKRYLFELVLGRRAPAAEDQLG